MTKAPDDVAPLEADQEEQGQAAPAANSIVVRNSVQVAKQYRIIQFRGRAMILLNEPYEHFVPLHRERFDRIGYPVLGGVTRSRMSDVLAYLANTAEDLSEYDHYILFGGTKFTDEQLLSEGIPGKPVVWDMKQLRISRDVGPESTVWRSPYPAAALAPMNGEHTPVEFVMQLAGGSAELYDDIMQSIAPIIMDRKPDGVVWWVGDGANGKSTLMDALYRIFPGQLASITVKRLTDGRDTPSLNGTLANVVKESSEGRVDDTEIYKSIGTHEDFRVHKFHSQDDVTIKGNVHHIFSANSIPAFNDKGFSARRRTFIIPFNQRFESDPTFEQKTFTPKMFGELIAEMCYYADKIKRQNYRYKWSAITLASKAAYDTEANNAEEYAAAVVAEGVIGFETFNPVRIDYENWCADNGYVALGIGNLRRAMQMLGFERVTGRDRDNHFQKRYRLPGFKDDELQPLGVGRPGLFTAVGFRPPELEPETVPEFEEAAAPEETILGGDW